MRVIVISEFVELSATTVPVPDPVIVERTEFAAPWTKVTGVDVKVIEAGEVTERVFASALVEAKVQVLIPEALLDVQAAP